MGLPVGPCDGTGPYGTGPYGTGPCGTASGTTGRPLALISNSGGRNQARHKVRLDSGLPPHGPVSVPCVSLTDRPVAVLPRAYTRKQARPLQARTACTRHTLARWAGEHKPRDSEQNRRTAPSLERSRWRAQLRDAVASLHGCNIVTTLSHLGELGEEAARMHVDHRMQPLDRLRLQSLWHARRVHVRVRNGVPCDVISHAAWYPRPIKAVYSSRLLCGKC